MGQINYFFKTFFDVAESASLTKTMQIVGPMNATDHLVC